MHSKRLALMLFSKFIIVTLFTALEVHAQAYDSSNVKFTTRESNWIAENHTIRVRVSDWPPYMLTEPGLSGESVDYLKLIAKHHHLNIEFVADELGWEESVEDVKTDKNTYDLLLTMAPSEERKKSFAITDTYLDMPLVIFMQNDSSFISSINDLNGKKLAIESAFLLKKTLQTQYPNIQLVEAPHTIDALRLVSNGQADAYIGNLANATFLIREHGFNNLKVAAPSNLENQLLAMAVRKDWPELASIISKSMAAMTPQEKNEIKNRWSSIRYEYGLNRWDLLGWISLIVVIALAIVTVVIRVNKILNKEIDTRKKTAEELNKYIKVVNDNVMIMTTDNSGKLLSLSKAFCHVTGFENDELVGEMISMTLHETMSSELFHEIYSVVAEKGEWQGEIRQHTKNGDDLWVNSRVSAIKNDGEISGLTFIFQDITDKKIVEKLSITDQLTGLFNRHKIEVALPTELARSQRFESPLSIALVDIDFFKKINDTYGHQTGDKALILFSSILKEHTRQSDVVGRWGGEEFLIICPGTDEAGIVSLTDKIRRCVEEYDFSKPKNMTVSFGATTYQKGDSVSSIIKRCDEALYAAKDTGRNKVVYR